MKIKTKNKFKARKGITLISLVITIIVLLLLAGISISMLTGDNGILSQTGNAGEQTEMARLKEEVNLKIQEREIDKYTNGDKGLETYLQEIGQANVEQKLADVWYVMRGEADVTVYENGEVVDGKVDIWDGASQEVPEFKEFNWYIYNCAQLKFFADFVNNGNVLTEDQVSLVSEKGYNTEDIMITEETIVYLMANLDLGARQTDGTLTSGAEWKPIGKTEEITFLGTFEGNDYTIRGVYVNQSTDFVGLFGVGNTIKNLTIKNSYIKGAAKVGGIIAKSKSGTIERCHNDNTMVVGVEYVGGVAGDTKAPLIDCTNSGTISGEEVVGGVLGYGVTFVNNVASRCVNTGFVSGINSVGGVLGMAWHMKECRNSGIVTGTGENIGGVVGDFAGSAHDCYNEGKISGRCLYRRNIWCNRAWRCNRQLY